MVHLKPETVPSHLDGCDGGGAGGDATEEALLHRHPLGHLNGRLAGDLAGARTGKYQ